MLCRQCMVTKYRRMSLFDSFQFLKASVMGMMICVTLEISFRQVLSDDHPDGAEAFSEEMRWEFDSTGRGSLSKLPEAASFNARRLRTRIWLQLHDHRFYYNVHNTPSKATISVLHQPIMSDRECHEVRKRSHADHRGNERVFKRSSPRTSRKKWWWIWAKSFWSIYFRERGTIPILIDREDILTYR